MKKQLLSAALLLSGFMAFTPSVEAKSAMDSNLTMEWMNTDVATKTTDCRQAIGFGGKFYLQNHTTGKIEVWDGTGKLKEIDSGGGTNITMDDAGNIIVRIGTFNTNYVSTRNELRIIPADGSAVVDIPLSGVPGGRVDFWGHVKGNVMDKTTGGILYMGVAWQPTLVEIPIVGGVQDVKNTYTYNYMSPFKVAGQFATTSMESAWNDIDGMSMLSPYYNKTNCNSIQKMKLDADGNWTHEAYYVTPRHSGCASFYIFKVGAQNYIVYPSGSTNTDGFSVSKVATVDSAGVATTDESVRIATKYAETNDDAAGAVTYKPNAFYGNLLTAEAISDHEAYIYQYYPSGYIAKYKLTLPASGVDNVAAPAAKVFGGVGEIAVVGDARDIAVYRMDGVMMSHNQANVKCAAGLYIVKVDGNATKVIVK